MDLGQNEIGAEGAGRLAAVLGQCASLVHLDLAGNEIGAEGAGRLAAVLGQCASLAHLDLGWNEIGDEGAGRLALVLGQCASLAHLNLSENGRGGLRPRPSIAHHYPFCLISRLSLRAMTRSSPVISGEVCPANGFHLGRIRVV